MNYTTAVNLRDWLNDVFFVGFKEKRDQCVAVITPSDERQTFWTVHVMDMNNNRSVITFNDAILTNYTVLGLEP